MSYEAWARSSDPELDAELDAALAQGQSCGFPGCEEPAEFWIEAWYRVNPVETVPKVAFACLEHGAPLFPHRKHT